MLRDTRYADADVGRAPATGLQSTITRRGHGTVTVAAASVVALRCLCHITSGCRGFPERSSGRTISYRGPQAQATPSSSSRAPAGTAGSAAGTQRGRRFQAQARCRQYTLQHHGRAHPLELTPTRLPGSLALAGFPRIDRRRRLPSGGPGPSALSAAITRQLQLDLTSRSPSIPPPSSPPIAHPRIPHAFCCCISRALY